MNVQTRSLMAGLALLTLAAVGCRSPYRSDQYALGGGLLGAGTGALIGHAVGNTAAGAVIGAGVGAVSGAVVGDSIDQVEAQNQAELAHIEAQLGRPVSAGAVTLDEVIAMTQAGVEDDVVVRHVQANGSAGPLRTGDIIYLKDNGVSGRVIQALQSPPPPRTIVREVPAPRPVIIEEYYYDDPYCHHPRYRRPRHHHHDPHISWGVGFHHH